ncbi:MAG: flavodoxin domain-containing protein, partial [Anaerolineae bacterium]
MNALIVYFSKFGNTRKVADAIAETLESRASVRVVAMDELAISDLNDVDLVVMG